MVKKPSKKHRIVIENTTALMMLLVTEFGCAATSWRNESSTNRKNGEKESKGSRLESGDKIKHIYA